MTRWLGPIFGATLVLLAVTYVFYDAWAWDRAATVVDAGLRQLATAGANERPGGIFLENDSYYWLSYAKRMGAGETWRVRYTYNDNTPYGRPVHWSQSISWLMVLFGRVRQAFTGEGWPESLERASVWINPSLFGLLVLGMGWALFRRVGPVAAGLFSINLVSLGDVGWEFQALRPDHQSLQALFGVFLLAGLVFGGAGWVRQGENLPTTSFGTKPLEVPGFRGAKRWFLVSGACAALSLWVSAVTAMMLLLILFGAGLLLAYSAPKLPAEGAIEVRPELWRWWGWVAGAGSFLLYLIEYFPGYLGFRLEINGPLYSVTAVAMGEGVCQFLRARYAGPGRGRASLVRGIFCTAVVTLVPLMILFGPAAWHALKDPQMLRFHSFIQEFYSYPRRVGPNLLGNVAKDFGILPCFLILAIALAAFWNLRLQEWAGLWLSFAVTLGVFGLGYLQVRWLGLYAAMNAWLAVVAGVCAWRLLRDRLPVRLRFVSGVLVAGLLLIQPFLFCQRRIHQVSDIIEQRTVLRELANPALNKRLALAFRAREGVGTRVMADPDFVPALQYFAEGTGVVAFYWEDLDGLHAATGFFADTDGEGARKIAAERGLTHVLIQEGDQLQTSFNYIATGHPDQAAAQKIFAARLMGSEFELPPWLQTTPDLQQIGSQLYTYCGMRFEERWRIYRISLGQKTDAAR